MANGAPSGPTSGGGPANQSTVSSQVNSTVKLNEEIGKNLTVHSNLGQDVIVTDANRVRLLLRDKYENLKAARDWSTPVAIFVSILMTLVSAEFKATWGLSAPTWHAMFIIAAILSGTWSISCIYKAYCVRGINTVEAIVAELLHKPTK